jgi:hypothetical protein
MAVDLGSSNTTRYHTVPDHADFTLPDGDWTWLTLCYPQSGADTKYIISTGDWGAANTINLYLYGDTVGGVGVRVASVGEVFLAGAVNAMPLDAWCWLYACRRSGNLFAGQISLGASSGKEAAAVAMSGSQDSTTGPYIGFRAAGVSRPWKGRWSQVAYIPGVAISADQAVDLARGAPLLSMPFAPSIKFLLHGRSANDATIVDLISGKVATKQGTSYGTNEEDAQTPYIWLPEYTRGVISTAEVNLTVAAITQSTTVNSSSISQEYNLDAGLGATQLTTVSSVEIALGVVVNLEASSATQATTVSSVAISQDYNLVADVISQSTLVSSVEISLGTLTQLIVDAILQGNSVASIAISQEYNLAVNAITQAMGVSSVDIRVFSTIWTPESVTDSDWTATSPLTSTWST